MTAEDVIAELYERLNPDCGPEEYDLILDAIEDRLDEVEG